MKSRYLFYTCSLTKMFPQLYVLFVTMHIVSSQLNGEFWWLNNKLAGIRRVEPPPPKFDKTDEFETDESVKVVFRDNREYFDELETPPNKNLITNKDLKWTSSIIFRDDSNLGKPVDVNSDIKVNDKIAPVSQINVSENKIAILNSTEPLDEKLEDVFEFVFPESAENSNHVSKKPEETVTVPPPPSYNEKKTNKISINDKIWFEDSNTNNLEETESICTFMKKRECIQNKGIVHMAREINCPKQSMEDKKVCCILPLPTEVSSKLKYPGPVEESPKRYKRSATAENISSALKQRNALLKRKFVTVPIVNPTATAAQTFVVTQKIVTPDEYVDPYWNVKNMKFRHPSVTSASQNTRYDYNSQDYDDYTVELPKPGLIGLYSDPVASQTTWKLSNKKKGFSYGADSVSEEDDDDDDTAFGYSSFDPRRGSRISSTSPKPLKRRPQKMTMSSEESQESSEPISFKSNPNFRVLEGFKLLNLAKNKNRHVRTPESNSKENSYEESNMQPCSLMRPSNVYEDLVDQDQQVYSKCGKTVRKYSGNIIDIAEEGHDPWLALIIRTKSPQKILCYATIVHPRAAVTAADCVSGSAPGELSVLAGVWDLSGEQSRSQQRLCTVHEHSLFNSELDNNIALLHWKRPLRLEVNIQPVCISDPHVGDECYFVGWGGYDQAIEKSSRRQKATILTPKKCTERISKPDIMLPRDSFCASVTGRSTVTGVGGPLLCRSGDRTSMVGLAVWREDVVVLLPVLQWVATTLPDVLQI